MAETSQRGIVLLSVIGVLLLLSLLARSGAQQMTWLLQNAQLGGEQRAMLAQRRQRAADLHGLDVSFLSPNQRGGECYRVTEQICGRFYAQTSSNSIWRFELEDSSETSTQGSLDGWVHRSEDASDVVAKLRFESVTTRRQDS